MNVLKVEGVSKTYELDGRVVNALHDITFTAHAGDFVTIQGPSGSGKTTLLSLIGGLDYPTQGKICYDNNNITALSLAKLAEIRRHQVAYIFQDYVLFDELTVLDNVKLPLQITFGRGNGIETRAREWIERVGLLQRIDHRPHQLSGGEKQRVGVARALAKQPALLLADEPTSNLDEENREIILHSLLEYQQDCNAIVLVSTHDPLLRDHASKRLCIRHGKMESETATA